MGADGSAMPRNVLVVTAATLSDDMLARAAARAGATLRRLGPGGALGDLGAPLDDRALAALRADLADMDVNALTPRQATPKRLLIADMDSTMITVECIDEIADVHGVGAEVASITERAMQGELDFEGALRARVALLKGAPISTLETVWRERVQLSDGAEAAVRGMAARGARTALVSGGFTYFTTRVAAACGFHEHQANTLMEKDGVLTGEPGAPILGRDAKGAALARILSALDASPEQALAVGDGANDLDMIEAAGLGVAYRAKPVVAERADARLDRSDLTALLYLQGISPD
ncbi:MAG: phosphoserine phosphatase SerB [Pseudomonadota bacterium]